MISFNADVSGVGQSLREFLDRQYVVLRPVRPSSHLQMRVSVKRFEEYLGRPAMVDDLERLTIAGWLKWLGERVAPATCKSKRRDLMSLASLAHTEGLLPIPLFRVPSPKQPRRVPEAWTMDQIVQLLTVARRHPQADVMVATIAVCWDSCCRISAVHMARASRYDARTGTAWLYESKTRTERPYDFADSTRDALARLPADRQRLCGDVCMASRWRWMGHLLFLAGFPKSSRSKFHRIRRSRYTRLAIDHGLQVAAAAAGHASIDMARFYNDTSLYPTPDFVSGLALPKLP